MKKSIIALAIIASSTLSIAHATSSEGKTRVEMGATQSNILHPDVNRYTYKNLSEFVHTKQIDNGGYKQVIELRKSKKPLNLNMNFDHLGKQLNLLDVLHKHRADAFIVLKDGKIVAEQYFDGQSERTHHQMMSVTKSFTGIIAASLVAEGKLDRKALVGAYIPQLIQSAFGMATVGQVLDMTNNLNYSESYEDPNAEVFKHAKTVLNAKRGRL
ncbi:6-aminohexanoate-dimer hydrolase [Vibrio variabilis]|uniref:6-aminohexanoate-dimer hydrolase n=1 Tax=Vibrio variabilis TaxID=990271 RepID=A0ABQ0JNX9_9VIBR|nr:6-aminohexanoate-dimer hydrolase [Vibrio variabilis]